MINQMVIVLKLLLLIRTIYIIIQIINIFQNFLTNSERISLKWYYHLFPLEYCSKSKGNIKLNKHKDFVFKSIRLEKFFEIDILQNAISKIKNKQMKINYLNPKHTIFKNYINNIENNKDNLTLNLITNKNKELNKYFDNLN